MRKRLQEKENFTTITRAEKNKQLERIETIVSKSVCRYYGTNDCKDFEPNGILYGLCKCDNDYCAYKDKPNKDDIVEGEL